MVSTENRVGVRGRLRAASDGEGWGDSAQPGTQLTFGGAGRSDVQVPQRRQQRLCLTWELCQVLTQRPRPWMPLGLYSVTLSSCSHPPGTPASLPRAPPGAVMHHRLSFSVGSNPITPPGPTMSRKYEDPCPTLKYLAEMQTLASACCSESHVLKADLESDFGTQLTIRSLDLDWASHGQPTAG